MDGPHSRLTMLPDQLDGVDDLSADVFRAFIGTLRLHRRLMTQALADQGVHHGQAMCLRMLAANDGITQRDMAEALHVAPPTVTRMLHSMQKAGLITRSPDAADQRLTRVELTEAGRAEELRMRAAAADYINSTVATLSEDDRRELACLLTKLSDSIRRASDLREAGRQAHEPGAGTPPAEAAP
jgi:MarR family transcriptional regulator, organic hydroperoxide resistance regulator